MDIVSRLRSLREEAGLTQEEVGKAVGVTKATVNRYETGEIDIKRTIAIKLAQVLNAVPGYIMGWEDSPTGKTTFDLTPIAEAIRTGIEEDEVYKEPTILTNYNKLNEIGKVKADSYVEGLLENPSYCNKSEINMVAQMPISVPPKVNRKRHT